MDWMRSGLISSLATPWPEGASTARLAAGWRLAGMGLRADFFAAFLMADFFAEDFAGFFLAGLEGMILLPGCFGGCRQENYKRLSIQSIPP